LWLEEGRSCRPVVLLSSWAKGRRRANRRRRGMGLQEKKKGVKDFSIQHCDLGNLRRDFLMRLEGNSKRIHEKICYGYVYSNTDKTQTPNKLKSTGTLLQTTLYECNDC
jgi:hypothetical protein